MHAEERCEPLNHEHGIIEVQGKKLCFWQWAV